MNQRDPRQRDKNYLGFVASLPCIACLCHGVHRRGVHVAHLRRGNLEYDKRPTGMAEKPADRWTTPLCPNHHVNGNDSQHHKGEDVFWEELEIIPEEFCIALHGDWTGGGDGRLIMSRFAAQSMRARHG